MDSVEATWRAREAADWLKRTACNESMPLEWFFSNHRTHESDGRRVAVSTRIRWEREATARGLQVCAECPVRAECLDAMIGLEFGTVGGLTETERLLERSRREREKDSGQLVLVEGSVAGSALDSVRVSEEAG